MDEDDHFGDGAAVEDSDDDMFDMFSGEVVDNTRPNPKQTNEESAEEDDDWNDVASMGQTDIDHEETPGAWIALPPEEKPPPTVEELRAINAGASEPLDFDELPCPDWDTIRLIDILPGTNDHGLSLTMRTRKISGPSKDFYLAVTHSDQSYGSLVQVPCNGRLLSVPSGIFNALLHIGRHLDTGLWSIFGRRPCVWIEAMSLEHNDRLWRARKTIDVFRTAERALIWLGNSQVVSTQNVAVNVSDLDIAAIDLNGTQQEQQRNFMLSPEEMTEILQDSWFTSRGSLQPFAAAKRRTVLLSDGRAIDITIFQQMLEAYGLVLYSGPMRDIRLFEDLWPQRPLVTNLHHYAAMNAETPHDIVNTLIGISCGCKNVMSTGRCGIKKCGLKTFTVSYDLPVARIYIDIARMALETDPMALLASAAIRQSGDPSWPSWVPDWRIAPHYSIPRTRTCLDESFGIDWGTLLWNDGFRMWDMERLQHNDKCRPPSAGPYGWRFKSDNVTPKLIGWVLQRPLARTKIAELSWDDESVTPPEMRCPSWAAQFDKRSFGSFLQPTKKYQRVLEKMTEDERRYQTVSAEWPQVSANDLVVFILGCCVSFVVRPASRGGYRLVDCIARPAALTSTHFAWLDATSGDVWAYGDCTLAPVELDLV